MLPYFPSTGLVLGQVLPTPGGPNIPTAQANALLLATHVQGILSRELPLKALGCTSHWLELLRLHSGSSLEPQGQHQPHAVWVPKENWGAMHQWPWSFPCTVPQVDLGETVGTWVRAGGWVCATHGISGGEEGHGKGHLSGLEEDGWGGDPLPCTNLERGCAVCGRRLSHRAGTGAPGHHGGQANHQ